MPTEVRTPEESFNQLHECLCDASWGHSLRSTTVQQIDCLLCFTLEMEPMRNGIVRQTRQEDARLICSYCAAGQDPFILPGGTLWHSDGGYVKCVAEVLWKKLKEQ